MTAGAGRPIDTAGLRIGYARRVVAAVPDLRLSPGAVWLVTGPNGSGKTTLLKTLAGLVPPVSGTITPAPCRGRGGAVFVHSTPILFRGSLRHNLTIAGREAGGLADVSAEFGLDEHLDRPARELSHGIRQRTALARAVLARPAQLLLDEPEGGLDESALALWRAFAARAVRHGALTLIIAAHRPAGLEGLPVRTIDLALR
jgi:ABC-type multidrug transport system ATPase subunit